MTHQKSSQGANQWDRNVHAMKFSAGKDRTDFLVMVLHLKANTTANFAEHREEEIKELLTHLPQIDKAFPKERDLVFLGDTNILEAKEPAVAESAAVAAKEPATGWAELPESALLDPKKDRDDDVIDVSQPATAAAAATVLPERRSA